MNIKANARVKYISKNITEADAKTQIVEEMSELTQAICKWNRVKSSKGCTPVNVLDAFKNMKEEVADVLVSLQIFQEVMFSDKEELEKIINYKLDRWVGRLKATNTGFQSDASYRIHTFPVILYDRSQEFVIVINSSNHVVEEFQGVKDFCIKDGCVIPVMYDPTIRCLVSKETYTEKEIKEMLENGENI